MQTELIPTESLTDTEPKRVTRYNYPLLLDEGTLIARKVTYATTDRIVSIRGNEEITLTTIGFN